MEDILGKIGENIRYYRKKAKLTQFQLAEKAGVHQKYIGNIERGQNTTISVLQKISEALHIELHDLCAPRKRKKDKKLVLIEDFMNLLQEEDEDRIEWLIEYVKPMIKLSKRCNN